MGRRLKNNIHYFSHDAAAWNNAKFQALRAHYGGDLGWAMEAKFWALNCMIADAEGCRLDLRRPFVRADIAQKLSLSATDFDAFIAFLGDPERCDLVNLDDGIMWTDRCQEELSEATKARSRDRKRKDDGDALFSSRNDIGKCLIPGGKSDNPGGIRHFPGSEAKRSEAILDDTKGGEAAKPDEPPAALFLSLLKKSLAQNGIELSPADLDTCAATLIARSADSREFIAFALEKCRKAKQKSTWFVKGIVEWDWIGKWREGDKSRPPAQHKPKPPEEPVVRATPEEMAKIKAEAASAGNRALQETSPPAEEAQEDDALAEVIF